VDNTGTNLNNRLGMATTGTLFLRGGEFRLSGNSGADTSETIATLDVGGQGGGVITLLPDAARQLNLTLSNLGGSGAGNPLVFRGLSATAGSGLANLTITTPNLVGSQGAGANGTTTMPIRLDILGDASATGFGTGFLVRDTVTNFWRPLAVNETETSPLLWGDNVNARVAGTTNLSANSQANSLTFSGNATLGTALDPAVYGALGGGNGLLLMRLSDASPMLVLDGANAVVNVGSITTGSGTTGYTHVVGTSSLTLNGYLGIGSTSGWVKAGSGTLRLNQRAFYTGPTTVNGGALELNSGGENTLAVIPGTTIPGVSSLIVNGAASVVDLKGFNQVVGALQNNDGLNAFAGGGTVTNTSGTAALLTSTGGGTFSGQITGNLAFTRAGNNTTLLTAPQSYTGPTVIRGGTLQLRDNASILNTASIAVNAGTLFLDGNGYNPLGTPNVSRISAATPIGLRGGVLRVDGTGSADISVNVNALTLDGASNTVLLSPLVNAGSTVSLTLGNIVRANPKSILMIQGFVGSQNGNGFNVETLGGQGLNRNSRVFINQINGTPFAAANLTNKLIGGWAIHDGSTFATYIDGVGVAGMGSTVQGIAAPGFDGTDLSGAVTATQNIFDSTTRTLSGNKAVNSLRVAAAANVTQTITLNSGVNLALGVGLVANGAGVTTLTGTDGTSTLTGPAGGDMYIWVNQSTVNFNTVIAGTSSLIKSGGGTLALNPVSGSNTYTGGTFVFGGTLNLNGDSGEVTVPGDLTVENGAVTMNTTASQIATGSNVTINNGSLTLANYGSATTQRLASLSFTNLGGAGSPTFAFGTPTANSTIELTAANAITAVNDSFATTPLISTAAGTLTALQLSHTNPVISTSGLSTNSLDIQARITSAGGPITKTGNGALTLRGLSTFTTGLQLTAGSLIVGENSTGTPVTSGPLGTGTLTIGNGTSVLSDGTVRTLANAVTVTGDFSFGGVTSGNGITLSGAVDLGAATRTITVPSPVVVGALSGAVTSTAGANALIKAGPGTLALGTSLPATFGVNVTGGLLRLGSASAIPSSVSLAAGTALDLNGLTITGLGFLSGSGFLTNSNATPATVILGGTSATDVASSGDATLDFGASDTVTTLLNITKAGTGTLTVNKPQANLGSLTVVAGSLTASAANLLSPSGIITLGTSATTGAATPTAILDITAFDQTIGGLRTGNNAVGTTAIVQIGAGRTLTMTGTTILGANVSATDTSIVSFTGGGSLIANGTLFQIGGGTGATNTSTTNVDLTGLASFTANLGPTGVFRVGESSSVVGGRTQTVTLAPTSTISANLVSIGGDTSPAISNTLQLGSGANTFNVNSIVVGLRDSGRGSGSLLFQGATGTLTVRSFSDPVNGRADLLVAASLIGSAAAGTGAGITGLVDLRGHASDLRLNQWVVGGRDVGGSVNENDGTFHFDTGTLDSNSLSAGIKAGGAANPTGTVNLGGGTTVIQNLSSPVLLGQNTTNAQSGTGTLNVSGIASVTVKANAGVAVRLGNATVAGGTATGTLNLTGGTLNLEGSLIRGAATGTSNASLTVNGGTLNMGGNAIGGSGGSNTGNLTALNFQAGGLQNVSEINNGATLDKTTAGTLILSGNNAYTGATTVSAGVLRVQSDTGLGSVAAGTTVASGAALEMSGGSAVGLESLTLNGSGISNGGALRNVSGANSYGGALTLGADSRINSDAGSLTVSNTVSGAFALTVGGAASTTISGALNVTSLNKDGAGTLTLSSSTGTLAGALNAGGGELQLTGTLSGVTAVNVNNGGTLLLGGSSTNRLSDTVPVTLGDGSSSGTLGFLAGASGASETLGALTLNLDSVIDFGTGSGNTLTFSSITLNPNFNSLKIYNWSGGGYPGTATNDPGTDLNQDRLLFTSLTGLTSTQLGQITFYSDNGLTQIGSGVSEITFGAGGQAELVPVPEPSTWVAGGLLLGLLGYRERRRLRTLLAGA
jgi:autotransporter-associated beta strand protein